MRKSFLGILFVILCLAPGSIFSQGRQDSSKEPSTKLEKLLLKKGQLVIKDSYSIGFLTRSGKSIGFSALVAYEPGMEAQRIKGIQIEIGDQGRVGEAMLDLEEIESAYRSISYMADLAAKWKNQRKDVFTEVTFSTRGDFKIGFYQKDEQRRVFIYAGSTSGASAYMDVDDLVAVKNILEKGLSLLKQK